MRDWEPAPYRDYKWIVHVPGLPGGKLAVGVAPRTRGRTGGSKEQLQFGFSQVNHSMDFEALTNSIELAMKDEPAIEEVLLPIIKQQNDLKLFESPMIRHASGAIRVSYLSFAHWLVRRAKEVGASNVLKEVEHFLSTTHVPMIEVTALAGVTVTSSIALDEHVSLVPFAQIPNSSSREFFLKLETSWLPFGIPPAALVRFSIVPKDNFILQGASPEIKYDSDTTERIRRSCLLLALILRSPIQRLNAWSHAASWIPLGDSTANLSGYRDSSSGLFLQDKLLTPRLGQYLKALYSNYWSMAEEERDSLSIALDRLNRAMRAGNLVDSAIDLGIALESFFMSDSGSGQQEIGFKLAVRVARLLAASFPHRSELKRLIGQLYKLRSEAVHSGKFSSSTLKKIKPEQCLQKGQKLIARALRATIQKRRLPDWDAVVFDS
jgi:hypothetical protein